MSDSNPKAAAIPLTRNPFHCKESRIPIEGAFTREEVQLALRQVEMPLEALRYDTTPVGLHYTLNHFDIPALEASCYRLTVSGRVRRPLSLAIDDLLRFPQVTQRVTLECAGNGRGLMTPRYPSMPWMYGAIGTAEWTGVRLRDVLAEAELLPDAVELSFYGADRGFDNGVEHPYGRSLKPELALSEDVLIAFAMNGAPLSAQHGWPLRLVVPGWYGMASVKWLVRIEAIDRPFDGYQQVVGYHYRNSADDPGVPVTSLRVKSLMVPPGIPDWYTGTRIVDRDAMLVSGRAWSGNGVPVVRVEVAVDEDWYEASVEPPSFRFAWQAWRFKWHPVPGEHELLCRATDASGATQPLAPHWNWNGMGNNACQRVRVFVR
ncbi:sulfite oxidase [Pelomicrobium methylotrophicum]|uniref:Sulfite oxidase n=1 Tax=Pelomicrobium methylotrophicum TaxID=2602750 RepID=A0A5C7EHK6_9PROT|nr:sulfite oxidase [Pelomicrobium methylotrophicum]TXF10038.1 sulfite oxidase [Pelomicrobium methylotrophicum]